MIPLVLSLSTLSLLALAAHFLRRGDWLPCLAVVAVLGMLLVVRRPWARRLAQGVLLLGIVVWCSTGLQLLLERQARHEPAGRLVVIFGGVVVVDALAAGLLGTPG